MTIQFKYPLLSGELTECPKELQDLLNQFTLWSAASGLPDPVVTEVLRSDQMQLNYYVPYARQLLEGGYPFSKADRDNLTDINASIKDHRNGEDFGVLQWALYRWTWHRIAHAVDLRNSHYRGEELRTVVAWLEKEISLREAAKPGRQWEFLVHDIGRGNHIHIGCRDLEAKLKFLKDWKPDLNALVMPPRFHGP